MVPILSPLQALVVEWHVAPGAQVRAGDLLVVLEAMKMEHEVRSAQDGTVGELFFAVGETVDEAAPLLRLSPTAAPDAAAAAGTTPASASAATSHPSVDPAPVHVPLSAHAPGPTVAGSTPNRSTAPAASAHSATGSVRDDLRRVRERHAFTRDAQRPEAMAKRHALGLRSARENIADLCDPGSFVEYGALAVAAQRSRRSEDDLVRNTPADGMVTGIGTIQAALFGAERAGAVVMAYDATVLAGTQGMRNHEKTDRMLGVALQNHLPVVLFAEGGGGRPGDVDMPIVAGLHLGTFASYAALNGRVPVLGIVAGRCFAGNAALLGCSDVVIATRGSNIGMGGPAMVEGGGLGVFAPEAIGPSPVQHANGVIDLLVEDEAAAVQAAKQYLGYFQGRTPHWQAPDAHALRDLVPENRLRVYDSRAAMAGIADTGSLLELRGGFGRGIHTALARLEGRPFGMLANNPAHLGGAIDADAADKAARFMQLCNAHGLPLVSLVDTPGFMVGPDAEAQAQVRHVSRMFIAAAHLRVPFVSVVLRKGYGLGAMAMAAGGFHAPMCTAAWPSGEFGGMGLEGAVRLGYRKELEALPAGAARDALFRQLVDASYARGRALNMAATLEIDAVIDPAETRAWLLRSLQAAAQRPPTPARWAIDSW